ncbi:2Fe-2S iron-sulfur cluster-binding protein [Mycoplasmatota bacterium WC30]
MKVKVNINQQIKVFECEPGDFLLDTLRKNNYLSVRRGCDTTNCGVCTVLLDGKPVPSCSLLTVKADGHEITTVEGIQTEVEKLGKYFGDEGADQCGYCNPSMALTVYAMKKELVNPSIENIKEYLVGNLCRCTGYIAQERAILGYLGDKS